MTIVVAAVAPDGIVLASDSRTTERSGFHRRVTSDSAHKVFEASGKFAAATYGFATIGTLTVRSLFDEWVTTTAAPADLDVFARELGSFFQKRVEDATPAKRGGGLPLGAKSWPLGLLVGGYGGDGVGRVLEVKIREDRYDVSETGATTEKPSVVYRGQTSALRRLIRGVDFDELREGNIRLGEELEERLETLHYELIAPITTQDAVDFAYFLIETTIKMQRFSDGTVLAKNRDGRGPPPGCGGPIQAIVIEPRRVLWLARNDLVVPSGTPLPRVGPD